MRILHFCLMILVFVNMFVVYKYFGEPFVEDPFLRRWDFLKFWITNQPLVFLFSLIFVSLNVCLYICTGFILISVSLLSIKRFNNYIHVTCICIYARNFVCIRLSFVIRDQHNYEKKSIIYIYNRLSCGDYFFLHGFHSTHKRSIF